MPKFIQLAVCVLVCLTTSIWVGQKPALAGGDIDFTSEKLIHFGMKVEDANKLVEDKKSADEETDWQIAYKIETASTMDIACRYKKEIYYQARFYLGRCYLLEKRQEVTQEEVQQVFSHYLDKYGESSEGTQSRDGRLVFARWDIDDREIALTAQIRSNGNFVLTYEDMAPAIIGEANYVQEQEIRNSQSGIDPITGSPR